MEHRPNIDSEIDEVIKRQPEFDRQSGQAWSQLAWKMIEARRSELAVFCFRECVRQNPTNVEAWANLGSLYRRARNLNDSIGCFRKALQLQANNLQLMRAIASTLREAGQREEAKSWCLAGLELDPNSAELQLLLGNILQELDEFDLAIEHLYRVIQIAGRTEQTLSSLGIARFRKGDVERAIEHFRESIALNPTFADGHFHLGMALLLAGDYQSGWDEYEWRPGGRRRPIHSAQISMWDGHALAPNQTLLLAAEQGFGDTIQFVRFAAEIKQRYGCRIVLQVQRPLLPLLSTCRGIDRQIARDEALPAIDGFLPLASLPSILRFNPSRALPQAAYLFEEPQRSSGWSNRLPSKENTDGLPNLRIGVAWQGDPSFPADHCRSIALSSLLPLMMTDNTRWISLQKGFGRQQLSRLRHPATLIDFGETLDADGGAFLDTAAIMKQLDLVITSDTSIAHLAGALGVPVWIALSYVPDWRWNLQRSDSLWYPTARLFRQSKLGDWEGVVLEMQRALRQLLSSKSMVGSG